MANNDSSGCFPILLVLGGLYIVSLIFGGGSKSYDDYDDYSEDKYQNEYYDSDDREEDEDENDYDESIDGTYEADVSYYNPDTDYSAEYTLDVEIEDGELTTIYFPKGGWLDESHIYSVEAEFNTYLYVEDDEGREWEVYIYQ